MHPLDGDEIDTGILGRRELNTIWQQSFLGHLFRVRDSVTEELLSEFIVEYEGIHLVGYNTNRELDAGDVPAEVEYLYDHSWLISISNLSVTTICCLQFERRVGSRIRCEANLHRARLRPREAAFGPLLLHVRVPLQQQGQSRARGVERRRRDRELVGGGGVHDPHASRAEGPPMSSFSSAHSPPFDQ